MLVGSFSISFQQVSLPFFQHVNSIRTIPARLATGALIIAGELILPTNISLFVAAFTLQDAALGLLLLSTIGFIGLAYVHIHIPLHHPLHYAP